MKKKKKTVKKKSTKSKPRDEGPMMLEVGLERDQLMGELGKITLDEIELKKKHKEEKATQDKRMEEKLKAIKALDKELPLYDQPQTPIDGSESTSDSE